MKQGTGRKAAPVVFGGLWLLAVIMAVTVVGYQLEWLDRVMAGFRLNDAMRVISVHVPGIGMDAGQDVVLRVDGQDVSHPWDLRSIVEASGGLAVHEVLLRRSDGDATVSIPAHAWGTRDLMGQIGFPLLLAFLHMVVATLAFWKARMYEAATPLIGYCGAMAFALLAPHLPLKEAASPEPWRLGAMAFPIAAALHMTMGYPAQWRGLKERWWLPILPYVPAAVVAVAVLGAYAGVRWSGSGAIELFVNFVAGLQWVLVLAGASLILANVFETARRSAAPGARVLARIELELAVCAFLPFLVLAACYWIWPHPALGLAVNVSLLLLPLFPLAVVAGLARWRLNMVQKWVERFTVGVMAGVGLILVYAPGVAVLAAVSAMAGWDDAAARMAGTVSAVAFCPLVIMWTKRFLDWLFERRKADFGQVVGDFSQAIRHLVKADDLLRTFMARCEQAYQPRYLLVYWREEGEEQLVPRMVLGIAQERAKPMRADDPGFPRYVGAYALKGVDAAARGERQSKGMAIALRPELDGPAQALVVIGPRRTGEPFSPDDFELLTLLGDQLQVGLEHVRLIRQVADQEKLRHELEIARQVQMGLLPKRLPDVEGMEVAGSSDPALEVGGDLYDIVELEGGRLGILVGDVSGKGMPAALLMSTALACFRTAYARYDSPSALMSRMNDIVAGNRPKEDMFVACCYAIWEPAGRLIISNGGMPMPLLNGEEIQVKGPPLGMMQGYTYREKELPIQEGDMLLFWSDGLEDVHEERGKTFGYERIIEIARQEGRSAEALRQALMEAVLSFRGQALPFDDITIVTARTTPVGARLQVESSLLA